MSLLTDNIKRYAKLRGLSLQSVAERAGLSKNIIYKWTRADSSPSKASVKAIADALNVTYEDLTGEKTENKPTTIDVKAAIEDEHTLMTFVIKPTLVSVCYNVQMPV